MKDSDMKLAGGRSRVWTKEECNLENVLFALAEARRALVYIVEVHGVDGWRPTVCSTDTVLPEATTAMLAIAYNAMHELDHYLPSVEAWCVVKHYKNNHMEPKVWIGCSSKEQAEAFAVGIAAHYVEHYGMEGDRWVAERAPCRVQDIVIPDVTVYEYLDRDAG